MLRFAAFVVFVACLVTVSVIDLDLFLIPNRVVYPSLAALTVLLVLAAAIDGDADPIRTAAIGGLRRVGGAARRPHINPAGMGFGDVRLAGVIGVALGWLGYAHVVAGLFAGFVAASVVGIALLLLTQPRPQGPGAVRAVPRRRRALRAARRRPAAGIVTTR